ncbi:MAG TPA: hypothetical protein VES73_05995 [Lamprocystis sp. (in: g-proteobacteria)]|nr:hypothetical protein [Lamprocystis sp. (in: g-proteobacteria)]
MTNVSVSLLVRLDPDSKDNIVIGVRFPNGYRMQLEAMMTGGAALTIQAIPMPQIP